LGEFEDKLNTVLSSPQAMEQIMALARTLGGGEGQNGAPQAKQDAGTPQARQDTGAPQARSGGSPPQSPPAQSLAQQNSADTFNPAALLGNLDPKVLSAIARVASEYSHGADEKAAFLLALRPFLKESRAAKMDRALQIARLAHIAKIAFESFRKGDTDV